MLAYVQRDGSAIDEVHVVRGIAFAEDGLARPVCLGASAAAQKLYVPFLDSFVGHTIPFGETPVRSLATARL